MDSVESEIGTRDGRSGEDIVDDGGGGVEVGEAPLLIGEHLLLAVADDSDGEIVEVATLSCIRSDAGQGSLGSPISRYVAGIAADIYLVISSISAEAESPNVDCCSTRDRARWRQNLGGTARD